MKKHCSSQSTARRAGVDVPGCAIFQRYVSPRNCLHALLVQDGQQEFPAFPPAPTLPAYFLFSFIKLNVFNSFLQASQFQCTYS